MDSFDCAILDALQNNSRISTESLGSQVGLSASACQRRIQKLKAAGVIAKEVAILDRTKLPGFITVIVEVSLERGGEQALDKFIALLNKAPQVQQFYYMAGEVDFILITVMENMEEFDRFSREVLMSNSNVKKFTSKVAISADKVGLRIPVKGF